MRRFSRVAAAVLSFFGLIHGAQVGIGVNLDIVVGYLLMAGLLGFLAWRPSAVSVPEPPQLPGTEVVPDIAPEVAAP